MSQDASRRRTTGIALALAAAVFAFSPVAAIFAHADGASTLAVVTLRAATGAVLLAPLLPAMRRDPALRGEALRLGLLAGAASPPVSCGVIGAVAAIPVGLALLGEWLTARQWLGVALAVSGLVLFERPARVAAG